jgi:hypothetical protein
MKPSAFSASARLGCGPKVFEQRTPYSFSLKHIQNRRFRPFFIDERSEIATVLARA